MHFLNQIHLEKIIELSKTHSIIRGIVGWTDLTSEHVSENVKRLKQLSNGKLVGIRHLIQLEEDEDWVIRPDVLRGLAALQENNLAFDLSCNPQHLKYNFKNCFNLKLLINVS